MIQPTFVLLRNLKGISVSVVECNVTRVLVPALVAPPPSLVILAASASPPPPPRRRHNPAHPLSRHRDNARNSRGVFGAIMDATGKPKRNFVPAAVRASGSGASYPIKQRHHPANSQAEGKTLQVRILLKFSRFHIRSKGTTCMATRVRKEGCNALTHTSHAFQTQPRSSITVTVRRIIADHRENDLCCR